jgi:hypothetical protein
VIHIGFDVLVELLLEAGLDSSLVGSAGVLQPEGHGRVAVLLTVKIRQPSHEFTFGVGISFIPYPLVLTPVV